MTTASPAAPLVRTAATLKDADLGRLVAFTYTAKVKGRTQTVDIAGKLIGLYPVGDLWHLRVQITTGDFPGETGHCLVPADTAVEVWTR